MRRETPGLGLTIVGGGSTYTPELIDGIIARPALPITRIVLMDPDTRRLQAVGGLASRMLVQARHPAGLVLETSLEESLPGADFVITQLRVGGNRMRLQDETIPRGFGCIGQETVGAGGFASALRNLPALMKVARAVEKHCPMSWWLNFSNPSGLVTEALIPRTRARLVGLCNVPLLLHTHLAVLLSADPGRVRLDYAGLNHLSWVTEVYLDGEPVMDRVLKELLLQDNWLGECMRKFDPGLVRELGLVPSPYLRYYYHPDRVLAEQMDGPPRAREVLELEEQLLRSFEDPRLQTRSELLARRGGALYSRAALEVMEALSGEAERTLILNLPAGKGFPHLPPGAVVEAPAGVSRRGIRAQEGTPWPEGVAGLVRLMKSFETLTASAALDGDREAALEALMLNPLVGSYHRARGLREAIYEANAPYLEGA